jgi:hypothetical protein
MNIRKLAQLLVCGCAGLQLAGAQAADPELLRQVSEVKEALARNNALLRQYTWVEHTEVLIKGDVKNSSDSLCRYDGWGEVQKKQIAGAAPLDDAALAKSNRPLQRKKADMQDYIERAVSLVHTYLPPKPDRLQYLLQNGGATFGQTAAGAAQIQLKKYWKDGDSLTFTFDPQTKALLKASIKSYLANEKDPVTMDAVFATLPDGTNHLASTVLNGEAKKIQVKTQNSTYQKLAVQ